MRVHARGKWDNIRRFGSDGIGVLVSKSGSKKHFCKKGPENGEGDCGSEAGGPLGKRRDETRWASRFLASHKLNGGQPGCRGKHSSSDERCF